VIKDVNHGHDDSISEDVIKQWSGTLDKNKKFSRKSKMKWISGFILVMDLHLSSRPHLYFHDSISEDVIKGVNHGHDDSISENVIKGVNHGHDDSIREDVIKDVNHWHDHGSSLQDFKHAMIFWQNVEESCTFQTIYGVGKV
jgi:hypothetical protein